MMGSPVGMQDVVLVAQITKTIVDRYKDAPDDRRQLVHLCESIHAIVEPIEEGKFNEMRQRKGTDYLEIVLKGLQATLQELSQFLEANQLTSGLEGFFKRMDFALRTKGQRDRLKEELDMHLISLNAALSVSGLNAHEVLLQQLQIMGKKQDAGDDATNQILQLVIKIHHIMENNHGEDEAKSKVKTILRTKSLQERKDILSLEPLITAYSSKTGIDKGKVERTMTVLLSNDTGTSTAASNGDDMDPNQRGKSQELSASGIRPLQQAQHSYTSPHTGTTSSEYAPRITVKDMEREEQIQLRERLRQSSAKCRELETQLGETQKQCALASNRAIRAQNQCIFARQSEIEAQNQCAIAEESAAEAQSRSTIARRATVEIEQQLVRATQRQHAAERQRSIAVQYALNIEQQLPRLEQEAFDAGQRYAMASPRTTVTQVTQIQVARLDVNQTIIGPWSCPSSPGPFHSRSYNRPSPRQPILGRSP